MLGQVRLGQVRLGWLAVHVLDREKNTQLKQHSYGGRLGQVRLSQVRLDQVRLGQVRLCQVRLGWVRLSWLAVHKLDREKNSQLKQRSYGGGRCILHPVTGHEVEQWEMSYCCVISLTTVLCVGQWSRPFLAPATLPAVQGLSNLCVGAELALGLVWTGAEILASAGFHPRTVRSVASFYTD